MRKEDAGRGFSWEGAEVLAADLDTRRAGEMAFLGGGAAKLARGAGRARCCRRVRSSPAMCEPSPSRPRSSPPEPARSPIPPPPTSPHSTDAAALMTSPSEERRWRRFVNVTLFPFPLSPLFRRRTLRTEILPGTMWSFEQEQGLAGTPVSTNVRMTVVRLSDGTLWVHAPIAPTRECVALLRELALPVSAIVVTTYAYEHRSFAPPFCRRFPDAKLYSVRGWSWPVQLPDPLLGLFVDAYLDGEREQIPWLGDIDFRLLPQSSLGIAPYTEAAFLHRATRTLLTTDVLVYVPDEPPAIIPEYKLRSIGRPDALLARLRAGGVKAPPRQLDERQLGWMRMATLALFLGPKSLLDPRGAFASVANRLTISPVLRVLVYGKIRPDLQRWLESVLEWDFDRVVPAHFAAPLRATADDVRYALRSVLVDAQMDRLPDADVGNLRFIDRLLRAARIVKPNLDIVDEDSGAAA